MWIWANWPSPVQEFPWYKIDNLVCVHEICELTMDTLLKPLPLWYNSLIFDIQKCYILRDYDHFTNGVCFLGLHTLNLIVPLLGAMLELICTPIPCIPNIGTRLNIVHVRYPKYHI